jgi:hypothetical protein
MCIYSNKNNSRTPSKMSTFDYSTITTEAGIKAERDALTKRLAEIKKGDKPVKEEPAANGGAGKAVVEPKTPVKGKKETKAETPSAPAKKAGKKAAVEKTEPAKEEKKEVAEEVAKTGAKDIKFGAKDKHTETLKKGLGDADKAEFENAKKAFKKYALGLTEADYDAKTLDEHVQDWLKTRETKVEEPVVPTVLTLAELMERKNLVQTKTGMFWDPDAGENVTGPTDSDEGLDEVGDYLVGENTKRVYNGAEEFLGYAGIGKFKDLKA